MNRSSAALTKRIGALAAAAALVVALMSGCAVRDEEIPSGPNPGPAVPTSNPSITPTVPAGGTPFDIDCDQLLSAQSVYDFNPNFGLIDGFIPPADTPAATAVRNGGTACEWMNQTSGEVIVIAVATPGETTLAAQAAEAAKGSPVSGYGDEAHFATGRIDVFQGEYWLVATSAYFGSAEDAAPLLTEALAALS